MNPTSEDCYTCVYYYEETGVGYWRTADSIDANAEGLKHYLDPNSQKYGYGNQYPRRAFDVNTKYVNIEGEYWNLEFEN